MITQEQEVVSVLYKCPDGHGNYFNFGRTPPKYPSTRTTMTNFQEPFTILTDLYFDKATEYRNAFCPLCRRVVTQHRISPQPE